MASSNPAFSDKALEGLKNLSGYEGTSVADTPATIQGTVNKTMFLLGLLVATSAVSWTFAPEILASGMFFPIMIGTAVLQIVMTIMICRNPTRAKTFGIVYALTEGVVLGALSYTFERLYPNIVFQAVIGTCGVILGMLLIYKLRIIKVTENFKIIVGAATTGVFFVYLISLVMNLFGVRVPYIHEGGMVGIGFSLLVIGIAAMNLAVDFDFIETCEEQKAPSYMEWYGAFGLLLTIIWLYIEILRLLSKSRK